MPKYKVTYMDKRKNRVVRSTTVTVNDPDKFGGAGSEELARHIGAYIAEHRDIPPEQMRVMSVRPIEDVPWHKR